jgi:hypothetical protein
MSESKTSEANERLQSGCCGCCSKPARSPRPESTAKPAGEEPPAGCCQVPDRRESP